MNRIRQGWDALRRGRRSGVSLVIALCAVENDVAKGVSETAFAPNDNCTRAQIVTLIYRCRK